jgi:diaminopimelate decarboxylase
MEHFNIRQGEWFVENVALSAIAKTVDTPCYVYSKTALEETWQAFDEAFDLYPHQIHYAVKANSTIAILTVLANLGSGFDIVSLGELKRVLKAGGDIKKIVFSGVGKTSEELLTAIELGIACINVESNAELSRLSEIAATLKTPVSIALRVNPNVDPLSHPYISTGLEENKFGIPLADILPLCLTLRQSKYLRLQGLAFHIGSQITTLLPILEATTKVLSLMEQLKSHDIFIEHLNIGGGLGVCYDQESPPTPVEYVAAVLSLVKPFQLTLQIEPGRSLVAPAGVLLTKIEYLKNESTSNKNFAIVDAAMNDLMRPALYDAWHDITPLKTEQNPTIPAKKYDIVGPVCETGDFLGKDRLLSLSADDYLMIRTTGAYGFSMSSNYNTRPRAAEVMVQGESFQIIRPRENIEDLFSTERSFQPL